MAIQKDYNDDLTGLAKEAAYHRVMKFSIGTDDSLCFERAIFGSRELCNAGEGKKIESPKIYCIEKGSDRYEAMINFIKTECYNYLSELEEYELSQPVLEEVI